MEKRHCRDIHKDPVISAKTCPLCYAFCRIPAFAQLWGSEEDPAPLSMPIPHPSPYVAPKDCRFKGEDQVPSSDLIRLGLPTTGRDYRECGNPSKPLGPYVCSCQGCGDKCPGYSRALFDSAYVINLKRRPDRLARFRETFASWPYQTPEVFEAVDGARVPMTPGFQEGPGAWGCLQSHKEVLRRALSQGDDTVLVFEDDAYPTPGAFAKLAAFMDKVPEDWDQLMLGGQHMTQALETKVPGVVRCTNTQRTHAYAVRGRLIRDLYNAWASPNALVHCDWIMGPMQPRYNVYAPEEFLFGQDAGVSDINSAINPKKIWNGSRPTQPVFLLDCPKDLMPVLRAQGLHTGRVRDEETDIDVELQTIYSNPDVPYHLPKWVRMINEECMADGSVCTIWHPLATVEDLVHIPNPIYQVSGKNLLEIRGKLAPLLAQYRPQ